MRLIDADKLKEAIGEKYIISLNNDVMNILRIIDAQTTYHVDKSWDEERINEYSKGWHDGRKSVRAAVWEEAFKAGYTEGRDDGLSWGLHQNSSDN